MNCFRYILTCDRLEMKSCAVHLISANPRNRKRQKKEAIDSLEPLSRRTACSTAEQEIWLHDYVCV